jgi:hypothetical protein
MNQTKIYFKLAFIAIVMLLNSCRTPTNIVSFPMTVSFNLGAHVYNCVHGALADCPPKLVELNYGKLKTSVTGLKTPQFSQTVLFEGSSFPNSSSVLLQNGTASHNSHKLNNLDCCITLEIPQDDGCTLTLWYIEGPVLNGSGPCPGPGNSNCFRWFKSVDIPKGTLKFSSFCDIEKNPFSLLIDQQDPSGFRGMCN